MVLAVSKPTGTLKKSKLLPPWLLRLIGITSLATAVVSLAVYWFKKYPPRRKISPDDDGEPSNNNNPTTENAPDRWSNKLLNGLKSTVRKNRKKMTISLKNTVLWNPSPDVETPIYAFQEHSIQLLTRLSYLYDIHILVHVNSKEEQSRIEELLSNAAVFSDSLDHRKVIYCSEEEGKIHIIRHIEPHVHIEGGWEKDDGEDIVKALKPHVSKIIWLMTKRRRDSFRLENIKQEDRSILGTNVELSDSLINSSIAQEIVQ
ncbi:hypothetical protein [Parasitella parasitica]|uniref:Peroxisome assembly protein 22 n=1 Tax=Parasitella parasitica TaxID=35722 RepID=A0A0B7MXE7_9FUNG|nr:hypothetical protein [Parasitella parasitica]